MHPKDQQYYSSPPSWLVTDKIRLYTIELNFIRKWFEPMSAVVQGANLLKIKVFVGPLDWVTQFLSHENGLFQHNFEPTGTKGKVINFHNISNFVPHNRSLVYKVNGW